MHVSVVSSNLMYNILKVVLALTINTDTDQHTRQRTRIWRLLSSGMCGHV